jgi:autonomous glycyl radical cofactor GrcA
MCIKVLNFEKMANIFLKDDLHADAALKVGRELLLELRPLVRVSVGRHLHGRVLEKAILGGMQGV